MNNKSKYYKMIIIIKKLYITYQSFKNNKAFCLCLRKTVQKINNIGKENLIYLKDHINISKTKILILNNFLFLAHKMMITFYKKSFKKIFLILRICKD